MITTFAGDQRDFELVVDGNRPGGTGMAVHVRKKVVGGLVGVALVVGAVIGGIIAFSGGDGNAPAASPTKDSSGDDVAAALRQLETNPAALVAGAAAPEVGGRATEAVPAGTRVDVDQASWTPDGFGGGTIVVTLSPPERAPQAYAVVMVPEPDGWKVLSTVALEEDAR